MRGGREMEMQNLHCHTDLSLMLANFPEDVKEENCVQPNGPVWTGGFDEPILGR